VSTRFCTYRTTSDVMRLATDGGNFACATWWIRLLARHGPQKSQEPISHPKTVFAWSRSRFAAIISSACMHLVLSNKAVSLMSIRHSWSANLSFVTSIPRPISMSFCELSKCIAWIRSVNSTSIICSPSFFKCGVALISWLQQSKKTTLLLTCAT